MMKKWAVCVVALGLLFSACGEDDPLDVAWQKFRAGEYADAHAAFTELIPDEREAYVGLGWTTMRMSVDSLDASDAYFAVVAGDSLTDAYAGWTAIAFAKTQHAQTVARAQFVVRRNASYVFTHDRTVTASDLLVHEGYGQFHQGNYTRVVQILTTLGVSVADSQPATLLAALEGLYQSFR